MKLIVTGHRGFIGSNFIKMLCEKHPDWQIFGLDAITYAAQKPMYSKKPKNLFNIKENINDQLAIRKIIQNVRPDSIIHFAAESHVCRSITGPKDFITTNIIGTWNLLEEFKDLGNKGRFLYVSTDEVFGEIKKGKFSESSPIRPRSPYAASKASADLLVSSYHDTYGMDTITVNCSNNFGPNQHSEKLIPKTIEKILKGEEVEIYGKGNQVRDWLFVEDCAQGVYTAFTKGLSGERYCIGGDKELKNLEVIKIIHTIINNLFPRDGFKTLRTKYVNARPTDDIRYALDIKKMKSLGWSPNKDNFEENLRYTILWYWKKMCCAENKPQGRGGLS